MGYWDGMGWNGMGRRKWFGWGIVMGFGAGNLSSWDMLSTAVAEEGG